MEGDEIVADFSNTSEEELELEDALPEPSNPILDEVLEKYKCENLLPLANRIIWLSSLKEALGYIPEDLYDYEELQYLVILNDERAKKLAKDNYTMQQKSRESEMDIERMKDSVTR